MVTNVSIIDLVRRQDSQQRQIDVLENRLVELARGTHTHTKRERVRPAVLLDSLVRAQKQRQEAGRGALWPTAQKRNLSRLHWHRGYCGVTHQGLPGNCTAADQSGSWTMRSERNHWRLRSACLRRCMQCQRCAYVSLSLQEGDCSWYAACNLSALQSDSPSGHRSARVRNSGRVRQAVPIALAEFDAADARVAAAPSWRITAPPAARASIVAAEHQKLPARHGYCGLTLVPGKSCITGDRSFWKPPPTTLAGCVARCRSCARCAVISFSRKQRDCSWYAECDLDDLRRPPRHADDYVSVRVRDAAAPIPPVLAAMRPSLPRPPRLAVATLLLGKEQACALVQ